VTGSFGNLFPARNYDYDPSGNIHGITRDVPGGAEPHIFEYDLTNRLASWTKPGRSQELTYDENGNRQSFSDDGQVTDYSYDPAARNILAGSTGAANLAFGSDLLGNVTGWGSTSLVYDANGRLAGVDDAGVALAEYVYNIDGQRARKSSAGEVTYFEYDVRGHLIHEFRRALRSRWTTSISGTSLSPCLFRTMCRRDFTVTPLAGANGRMAPPAAQTIDDETTTAFTVAPDAGYHIAGVTGCGGTLNGSTYVTGPITEDCTVTASFAINTYRLTTTNSGAGGGTVSGSPAGIDGGSLGTATYNHAAVVDLTQTPDAGSFFTGGAGTVPAPEHAWSP